MLEYKDLLKQAGREVGGAGGCGTPQSALPSRSAHACVCARVRACVCVRARTCVCVCVARLKTALIFSDCSISLPFLLFLCTSLFLSSFHPHLPSPPPTFHCPCLPIPFHLFPTPPLPSLPSPSPCLQHLQILEQKRRQLREMDATMERVCHLHPIDCI